MVAVKVDRKNIAINVRYGACVHVESQVNMLNELNVDSLHFNVSDGVFINDLSADWSYIHAAKQFATTPIEIHLKTYNPFNHAYKALSVGADRVAFHFEASESLEEVASIIKTAGAEVGLSFLVGSDISIIRFCPKVFDYYLIEIDDNVVIPVVYKKIVELEEYMRELCNNGEINDVPRFVLDYAGDNFSHVKMMLGKVDVIVLPDIDILVGN